MIINHTKFQIVCDRCGKSEFTEATEKPNRTELGHLGWQYWSRVDYGTEMRLLCPDCVAGIKAFLKKIGEPK